MADTPRQQEKRALASPAGGFRTPTAYRPLGTPAGSGTLTDEDIWKRLKEAGFDEEMLKRRDKAALVSYIAKLEAEMYDYQHNMGLLILEKKEWISKYEQIKSSSDSAEMAYKREKAAQLSALAEARKREDNLKKALGIEKESIASARMLLSPAGPLRLIGGDDAHSSTWWHGSPLQFTATIKGSLLFDCSMVPTGRASSCDRNHDSDRRDDDIQQD